MPVSERMHERCCAAGARGPFVLAGTERKYERPRPFTLPHLALDIEVDLPGKAVVGVATLSFERIDAEAEFLPLDAVGFEIQSVELLAGRRTARARYEYDGDVLRVRVPAQVGSGRVRVRYRAEPRRGLYFLAPDEKVPRRPVQVWSQCQDEDARHWFPCHDKPHTKMTLELTARVPPDMFALSNGDRVQDTAPRGKPRSAVYRYRMTDPIPSYLVTLVVGHFEAVEDRPARRASSPDVPITYYVPKDRAPDAARTFGQTPRMVELFGRLTGVPYPYSRYSQVVVSDFIFGGMENTTASTMYEHVLIDERGAIDLSSNDLVAHELAHHWFGDYVTCRDWSHAWLNEGFATFFEHLEREDRAGRDEYEYSVAADAQTYVSEAGGRYQRPIVCRDYEAPIDLFDRHLYEKGGLVLHMLRRELGDDVFWKGVRTYLEEHAHGIVETNDLQRALEGASGRSLDAFFDQWVYRPGHPVLEVRVTWEDSQVVVSVKQKQRGDEVPVFSFLLEVAIGTHGPVLRRKKRVSAREDTLVIPLDRRPQWVAFDPDLRVIGEVTFKAPGDMLEHQLSSGESARQRWLAAEALAQRDDAKSVRALTKALGRTRETWMVRAEAARGLGRLGGEDALGALLRHTGDSHPKVRRAVLSALGAFRRPEAAEVLSKYARRDPSYLVEAEACRSLGRTRDGNARHVLLSVADDPSWADVKAAGVLDGLAALRDDSVIDAVAERIHYGVSARTRRAAMVALGRVGEGRRVRQQLEDQLDDRDPYVRMTAVTALTTLADPRARGALRRRLDRERDGRVARHLREALASLGEHLRTEQRQLKDDLEQLRRELTELKQRLSKVEASKKSRPAGGAREVSAPVGRAQGGRTPAPRRRKRGAS
jgi:aminopeptidase N